MVTNGSGSDMKFFKMILFQHGTHILRLFLRHHRCEPVPEANFWTL